MMYLLRCAIAVGMNIDEAGREIFARSVERSYRLRRTEIAYSRNASVFDRYVGDEPRITRAVEDAGSTDEEIELCCLSRGSWFVDRRSQGVTGSW